MRSITASDYDDEPATEESYHDNIQRDDPQVLLGQPHENRGSLSQASLPLIATGAASLHGNNMREMDDLWYV